MKQSKSDIELHKKDQVVEKEIESIQQKDEAPTVENVSPHKEVEPVKDVQSQPQPKKQEEKQEKKPEKFDSVDIPELETVQLPQDKAAPKSEAPVITPEKPKQEAIDTKQSKKEEVTSAKKQDTQVK